MTQSIHPWGKLGRPGEEPGWLPLEAHCLDVAESLRHLITTPVIASRLATAAGRPLTPADLDRLCVLALLHDLGKANTGFGGMAVAGSPRVGHIGPLASLYQAPAGPARRIGDAVTEALLPWTGEALPAWLDAVFSHHGRPLDAGRPDQPTAGGPAACALWEDRDGMRPEAAAARLLGLARERYPLAWSPGELPAAPAFVHLFAGLLMLADWIGSSPEFHPLQPYADPSRLRPDGFHANLAPRLRALGIDAPPGDATLPPEVLAKVPALRPVQRAAVAATGMTVVVEGETGSGKTEAALLRWRALRDLGQVDGLYFALPTRVAAVEIHARVAAFVGRYMGPQAAAAVVLAVPGYAGGGGLAPPSPSDVAADARWAAERPKRYLAAQVAVGTVDQALLGIVRAGHAHMRLAALSRSLLVVDEVHASDGYMAGLTTRLLAAHRRLGGRSLLLSATLGGTARAALLGLPEGPSLKEALAVHYPSVTSAEAGPVEVPRDDRRKTVRLHTEACIDDPARVAAMAVAHAARGARVLVVRNTVALARSVAKAVEVMGEGARLMSVGGVPTLHHGRFGSADRRLLDRRVAELMGKGSTASGMILVGTQTLEQSLDIDADVLLTDLCPADVLLQRLGRLHRHDGRTRPDGFRDTRATVLVPPHPLSELADAPRWGLGLPRKGGAAGGVYRDLLALEATRRMIESRPAWTVPDDCRAIVEGCLHPEVRAALLRELAPLDPAWAAHAARLDGGDFSRSSAAAGACWSVDAPFVPWPRRDAAEALTRLGGADRRVVLPPGVTGPFGSHPGTLVVPSFMTPGLEGDAEPSDVVSDARSTVFRLGPFTLRYDRHGLAASAQA